MEKKSLSNTVGERINLFDNLQVCNVESFNNLFVECPLKGFENSDPVIIGELLEGNRRMILVGENNVQHKMYSDLLYGVERNEEELDIEEINGVPV